MYKMKAILVFVGILSVVSCQLLGGWMSQNPSDERWMAMLTKLSGSGTIGDISNTNLNIIQVKQQVVAGTNTYFLLSVDGIRCNLTIYTDLSNTNHITEDTCALKNYHSLGSFTPVTDRTDATFQQVVGVILDTASNQINSLDRLVDVNIITAEKQVVAGMNYHVKLTVGLSTCLKVPENHGMTSLRCPLNSISNERYIVNAMILWQSWMTPSFTVTSIQITMP